MTNGAPLDNPSRFPSASAIPGGNGALRKLLHFLEINDESKRNAECLLNLFTEHADEIVVGFYRKVQTSAISQHVTPEAIERLKAKQKAHWAALLGSKFDDDYARSVRRIGIQHRDIALSVVWYVAGYAELKHGFMKVIAAAKIPPEKKGRLLLTLEKYVAIDMALALSSYEAMILD